MVYTDAVQRVLNGISDGSPIVLNGVTLSNGQVTTSTGTVGASYTTTGAIAAGTGITAGTTIAATGALSGASVAVTGAATAATVAATTSVSSAKLLATAGAAVPAVAVGFGVAATEGYQIKVLEETVSFATPAKYKALTTAIPSGAVILSAQANIEATITAGGTSVKVGLGKNAGTTNTYGTSGDLVKNTKINTIPAHAVLSGSEQIDVCIVTTAGSGLGDTDGSVGSVRVRIVYAVATSLANAA